MGKKNKNIKRTRFQALNINITDKEASEKPGVVSINLELDLVNGTSKVFNSFSGIQIPSDHLVSGYFGENKWRQTFQINKDPDDDGYDLVKKLDRYKHVLAIDTNSRMMKNDLFPAETKISIGAAVVFTTEKEEIILQTINRPFLAAFNSATPENENWYNFINLFSNECRCTDPRKIALVVDSDLGNIDSYNKREKPIFNNFLLPEEFELIYATDKVSDNVFNAMIKRCHFLSNVLLDELKKKIKENI